MDHNVNIVEYMSGFILLETASIQQLFNLWKQQKTKLFFFFIVNNFYTYFSCSKEEKKSSCMFAIAHHTRNLMCCVSKSLVMTLVIIFEPSGKPLVRQTHLHTHALCIIRVCKLIKRLNMW